MSCNEMSQCAARISDLTRVGSNVKKHERVVQVRREARMPWFFIDFCNNDYNNDNDTLREVQHL